LPNRSASILAPQLEDAVFIVKLFSRTWRQWRVWLRTRKCLYLVQALPALLAAGSILALSLPGLTAPAQELEARYLDRAKALYKAKDYAGSMTCYDRLASLGDDRPDFLYGLALSAGAAGQTGRASVIMNALAPPDEPGYAPAHFWHARRLIAAPPLSADARRLAEAHLLKALDGELEDRDGAHTLLGELYLGAGQLDQAEPHLAKAVGTRPHLRIRLAQMYALRGDKERARGEAQLAISYFRPRASNDLKDRQSRLFWADAAAFLEDFSGAATVLQEGLNATDDPVYRAALAGVYAVWSDAVGRDPKGRPGDQLALVETGLRYDPANVGLLNRLLAAIHVKGPTADKARESLERLLASGKAPASVHFALGLDAWQRGKADEARMHLERADELAPQTPAITNNLAWVLASSEPADLPRALQLSNLAIERAPRDLNFRDTRGRIYAKMGRWKEALNDLEAALTAAPDDAQLHRALAEVYEHLGSSDMAAEHKCLAEKKPSDKAVSPPAKP
jgi:tetratricopeptide (TPR) repeat protein